MRPASLQHRQRPVPAALAAALLAALLAGCAASGGPAPVAHADIPATLPLGATAAPADTPALDWRAFVTDPALARLVTLALEHNRDLQVAVLNVERAQAQLGLADAARAPIVGVGLNGQRAPNSSGDQRNTYTAGVQLASWEIDLFGRLRAGSDAARAQLLGSEAGRRAAELSLTASVLQAALAVRADEWLLANARATLATRDETLALTRLREQVGAASLLDLQTQTALVAQARATLAQLTRQRAQDGNALALLLGQPVPDDVLAPAAPADTALGGLAEVPVGLSSAVLLRRPDVVQAEQTLVAAQANLGAARAALWPTITLTAQAGQASGQLSSLFDGGQFAYTVVGNALLTVFDGGRRRANIAVAESSQRIALAQYEKAVQSAFRDTADALAGLATWRDQLAAQQQQLGAARETARLVALRYERGAASALEQQDAQRSLFAAEQALVQTRLAELNNRVALFKALGA